MVGRRRWRFARGAGTALWPSLYNHAQFHDLQSDVNRTLHTNCMRGAGARLSFFCQMPQVL